MFFGVGAWTNEAFPCEIVEELSGGRMAELYLARLKNTGHKVVVKAVKAVNNGLESETRHQFLRQEAGVLEKLRLVGIPQFLGFWETMEGSYFIMSYHQGQTLEQYVQTKGVLAAEQVKRLALELCRILAYLHSNEVSVVHNDLKPANLLLQEDGEIVLLDFGLAEDISSQGELALVGAKQFFGTAAQRVDLRRNTIRFQGTPGYAAPECWHREESRILPATDIFALGATMFYLLEGRSPKECYGKFILSEQHFESVQKKNSWQAVLNKCCALDVRRRFQSAAQVYEALQSIK